MNDYVNGQGASLPQQWQQALAAMRESIAQAVSAMKLLNTAMAELKPLFESAEALHNEFSQYGIPGAGEQATVDEEVVPEPVSASAVAAEVEPPVTVQKNGAKSEQRPEVVKTADLAELDSMQKYTIAFQSEGPVDMMKVHTALESIEEISGMTLNDYGPNSAELVIWSTVEPASLPLIQALEETFSQVPEVETTDDGLLVRFA